MSKIIVGVPAGDNYLDSFNKFEKSLHHFHPELEVRRFSNPNPADGDFWYRAKPIMGSQLFAEGYETLILADADQIITGSLSDILNDKDEYDVGVVLNDPSFPIQVWDINPYYNNGLVVLKNKDFVKHWERLCFSEHFNKYQFREQDLLNILCSDYMNYKAKRLEGNKLYGEVAKPRWPEFRMIEGKVMLEGKELCVYHSGGGNTPDKGNYRIRFDAEVCSYIDSLIK